MSPNNNSHSTSIQHRRIGRKVLQADRLNRSLNSSNRSKTGHLQRYLSNRPRVIAVAGGLILVIVIGVIGAQFYSAQLSVSQKSAASVEQRKLETQSRAADACRRQKLKEKADQIGTITYDQLYDGNECDS